MSPKLTRDEPYMLLEQLDDIVRLHLSDPHYKSIKSLPNRIEQTARQMFLSGAVFTFDACVIRAAMRKLDTEGFIHPNELAYTLEDHDDATA